MEERITSRENEKIKGAARLLSSAADRRESGLFAAETPKLVLDLLAYGVRPKELYCTEKALAVNPALRRANCPLFLISDGVAEKLSTQKSPTGVCLVAHAPQPGKEPFRTDGRYVCLDRVQDPANVGATLRTAAAMGFTAAVLGEGCADPFSPKALRASMGAAVKLPLYRGEIGALCRQLAAAGVDVVAAALEGAQDIGAYRPKAGVAVLVGSEGQGLSPEALAGATVRLRIPMAAHTESLNAAAAAAIFLWEFRGVK